MSQNEQSQKRFDPELGAINKITKILAEFNPHERTRIIQYVGQRAMQDLRASLKVEISPASSFTPTPEEIERKIAAQAALERKLISGTPGIKVDPSGEESDARTS